MIRASGIFRVGLIDGSPAKQGAHRQSTFDRTGDHTGREAQSRRFAPGVFTFPKVRP